IAASDDPEGAYATLLKKDREALASLRDFALPLLDDLESLQVEATWGGWIERLGAIATRALRDPQPVLRVLSELRPMADVGPIDLAEVRLVLERRLVETLHKTSARREGRVTVASTDELRGMAFDVVFVPGLAERIFPQKVVEDPILPDAARGELDPLLTTN